MKRWAACAFALSLAVSVSLALPAHAQTVDPELQGQYDDAFKAVFSDPGNLDKTFRFSELAVRIGNFEAAISALERMLLINPNLPRVRLELGVLYFRLGSYQLAKTYLDRAVEGDNVPDEVRQRVETFLAEIEKRLSLQQFAGSIFGGMRYQTNANAGPSSGTVLANGFTATLANQFTKQSDENAFVSGNLRHSYDLQLQAGEAWETNVTTYLSEQKTQNQLDLIFLRVDSGPRGPFAPAWRDGMSWRPYVVANYIRLDDLPYLEAGGLGVNFMSQLSPRFLLDTNLEYMDRNFHDGAGHSQTITELDGSTTDASVALRIAAADDVMLVFSLDHSDQTTDGNANSFRESREWTGSVGATKTYPGFSKLRDWGLSASNDPWSTSLTVSRGRTKYNAPDPSVDPATKRQEEEFRATFV
ncbi:MAG: tetratricopeptide repeat protein [Proteobacteria bacterium]|nr:tetratricopeptide repeat protein [Pseudomonadota bacterium]